MPIIQINNSVPFQIIINEVQIRWTIKIPSFLSGHSKSYCNFFKRKLHQNSMSWNSIAKYLKVINHSEHSFGRYYDADIETENPFLNPLIIFEYLIGTKTNSSRQNSDIIQDSMGVNEAAMWFVGIKFRVIPRAEIGSSLKGKAVWRVISKFH